MKRILILAGALALVFGPGLILLASCAHEAPPEPVVKIQEANVAVGVKCNPKLSAEPDYPDTVAALAAVPHPDAIARLQTNPTDVAALTDELDNLGHQLKLLLSGRAKRIQRDGEKTAALEGCKGSPQ